MAESSLRTTPVGSDTDGSVRGEDDEEYNPTAEDSDDDEATIAKDEDQHSDGEVDMLQEESEMPLEELLKLYYPREESKGGESDKEREKRRERKKEKKRSKKWRMKKQRTKT